MGTALGGEARLTTVGRASASCSWPNVAAWTRRSGGGPAARQWKRTRTGDRREGGRGRGVVVSRARPAMGKSGGGGACCLFCVLETLARFLPAKVGPFFVCHAAGACFRDLHSPLFFPKQKRKTKREVCISPVLAPAIFSFSCPCSRKENRREIGRLSAGSVRAVRVLCVHVMRKRTFCE